ncbi:MAG TPA: helix-turn-helix domain-containing protein [Anaerolineales bacterium]|nr:helix-turn-helix domain-containing protein [Anaerolineales bacterium]
MTVEITFGQHVKIHRQQLGLTQKQLAYRVGCASVTLRKIESDDLRPSGQIAERLAKALKLSSRKRAAFVRFGRGQQSPSDLAQLLNDETKIEGRAIDYEPTYITTLTAADNPYKGLRAFDESDATDFFGREALIQQLLSRIGTGGDLARFLTVVGPSGSGKSSVVHAGVIPALKRGALPGSENWLITALVPGSNPLEELEAALLQISSKPHLRLIETLRKDSFGLLRAVNDCLPDDPAVELLMVIDQFEEVFTLVQEEEMRTHLLTSLLAAVLDERSRVRIVVTLRADFLDRLLNFMDFSELVSQRTEFILPLTTEELERAIESPAKRVGLKIDDGVVPAIIHDLGDQPGALPLLQYSLTELFEKRKDNTVTRVAYQAIGGVLGAVGKRAEQVFTGLDVASQGMARQLFLRLVTLGEGVEDTRRRVLLSELESLVKYGSNEGSLSATETKPVLDSFGQARLLTFDRDPLTSEPTVEIAHEVLIQAWSRLRNWLADSRENLHVQRQIMSATREWISGKQDPSFLATGARLVRFESMATDSDLTLNDEERAFLNSSVAERERREEEITARQRQELNRQRWIIMGLTVFLIVAIGLSLFAFNQRRAAQTQAEIAFSRQLAAQALAEVQKPLGNDEYGALLAIRSLKYQYDPVADAALVDAAGKLPIREFKGHSDSIRSIAISPTGKYLLTGSADMTLKLSEIATGKEIRTFYGHNGEILDVAFSPDGKSVLCGSMDTTAKLWDVTTGQEIYTLQGELGEDLSVAFSPDGKYILTTSRGTPAQLWEAATGHKVRTFAQVDANRGAVFSPDGKYILAASDENTAKIWETNTGREVQILRGHVNGVFSTAFSADGKYALTGSIDNTAKLWDVSTGQEVYTLRGHSGSVRSVAFSPDSKYILTGSADRTARLWDFATGQEVRTWRGHSQRVLSAVFSPDGKFILTGSQDGIAKLWDFAIGQGRILRGHSGEIYGTAISSDGTYILTSGMDSTARVWDISTGEEVGIFSGHEGVVYSVSISPDAKHMLTSGQDGMAQVWDIATGQGVRMFSGHFGPVYDAVFSPDGTHILTAGDDRTAKLWETSSGRELRTFSGHKAAVFGVAFSPDGSYLATGSDDGTTKIWNVDSGEVMQTFQGPEIVYEVTFSSDGKYLLTGNGDSTAQLWDVAAGKEVLTLNGHTNTVYDVAFSPDDKYAVTASADRTAKIWNLATGEELRTLSGHSSAIWSAGFSPDGKFVLTGSLDGTARLWEVDYRDFVVNVCARLFRDFTEEERIQARIEDQDPACP